MHAIVQGDILTDTESWTSGETTTRYITKGNVNVLVITILRAIGSYGGEPIKNLVLLTEYTNVLETKA